MIVYDGLKSDFLRSVQEDTLAEEIEQCVLQRLGHHTVQNEFMSWVNSYNYMYKVLSDPGIAGGFYDIRIRCRKSSGYGYRGAEAVEQSGEGGSK